MNTPEYIKAMTDLVNTQTVERQNLVAAIQASQQALALTFQSTAASYAQRDATATGVGAESASLAVYDAKAAQERADFIKSYTDAYGQAINDNLDFQKQLALIDQTHADERLQIEKSYAGQSIEQLKSAQNSVSSLFSSIADYAHQLQTGTDSPLSPLSQYDLANSQFNAVSSAALAGDATSAGKLTSYADALLSASRDINGSGAGYATDFQRVLDALQGVTG